MRPKTREAIGKILAVRTSWTAFKIKALRTRLGLSQEELARVLCYSTALIRQWEAQPGAEASRGLDKLEASHNDKA